MLEPPQGTDARVDLVSDRVLTEPRPTHPRQNQTLQLEVDANGEALGIQGRANPDVLVPYSNAPFQDGYFTAHELYAGTPASTWGALDLQVGRKLENWSALDQTWQLGMFEPRLRYDYLRPRTQGLTGAFLGVREENFEFVGFGTVFHLPDQEPPFENKDGEIRSRNRWVRSPSTTARVMGRETHVHYTVVKPKVREVVLNPGGGLRARVGSQKKGPWAGVAYAYKPMNQFIKAYRAYLNLQTPNQDAQVDIYPTVQYHHVGSLDSGIRLGSAQLVGSMVREVPVVKKTDQGWNYQGTSPTSGFSGVLENTFWGDSQNATRARVGYLHLLGGTSADEGDLSKSGRSIFDRRWLFDRALLLGGELGMPGRLARWVTLRMDYLHDLGLGGEALLSELVFRPSASLELYIGADIIGFDPSVANGSTTGVNFFQAYQGNDRVFGGLGYVF